jgi:transcription-repair coupling factor (superfamily II helicase)
MITLFLTAFSRKLNAFDPFRTLLKNLRTDTFPQVLYGPQGSFFSLLLRETVQALDRSHLVVLPTEQEAMTLVEDLERFGTPARFFPSWGTVPYKELGSNAPVFGQRVKVLVDLPSMKKGIVVTSLRAFLHLLPERSYLEKKLVVLRKGQRIDPQGLAALLASYGYLRVPKVSIHGEFALRGEVLDVYLPGHEEAYRILLEFDSIAEIRTFSPETQASLQSVGEVILHPGREVLWSPDRLEVLTGKALPTARNGG